MSKNFEVENCSDLFDSYLSEDLKSNMNEGLYNTHYIDVDENVFDTVCVSKSFLTETPKEIAIKTFSEIIEKLYSEKLIHKGFLLRCGIMKLNTDRYLVISYPLATCDLRTFKKLSKRYIK